MAIGLAEIGVAEGFGGPFGAVVVLHGRILGRACNRVLADRDPTAHAEVLAIRQAAAALGSPHLTGAALYASCEPCPMCLGAALWARLERVYFSASRADAAAAGFDDESFHELIGGGGTGPGPGPLLVPLLPGAGGAPFKAWTARPDRQTY
jgi:guanine deaminase